MQNNQLSVSNGKNNKRVFIIVVSILAMLLLLLSLLVLSGELQQILKIKFLQMSQSEIIKFKLINLMSVFVYSIFFAILGYKTAVKRKLNIKKWTILCAIFGLWAYLLLIFRSQKIKR
jgi:uncharacterized BrkB/YihY/UPF0761 family membrane protein